MEGSVMEGVECEGGYSVMEGVRRCECEGSVMEGVV